jgi:soluble lytic murein transglycosylase-like protein
MTSIVLFTASVVGVNKALALALFLTENPAKDPNVVGITGDLGLLQLNPKYVEYFVGQYWDMDYTFDVWDPKHNAYVGLSHLKYLLDTFDTVEEAVAAYNCGEGRVLQDDIPLSTIAYVYKITGRYL